MHNKPKHPKAKNFKESLCKLCKELKPYLALIIIASIFFNLRQSVITAIIT